jgi:hypothetical protein
MIVPGNHALLPKAYELLGSQCSQSDIKITPALGEFVELNVGGTLCRKAEAEGFEPSVEVLAPTTV